MERRRAFAVGAAGVTSVALEGSEFQGFDFRRALLGCGGSEITSGPSTSDVTSGSGDPVFAVQLSGVFDLRPLPKSDLRVRAALAPRTFDSAVPHTAQPQPSEFRRWRAWLDIVVGARVDRSEGSRSLTPHPQSPAVQGVSIPPNTAHALFQPLPLQIPIGSKLVLDCVAAYHTPRNTWKSFGICMTAILRFTKYENDAPHFREPRNLMYEEVSTIGASFDNSPL
eukprot:m.449851 g.449851  ORF g.449851 m.449851 type:complete len:225 (+) comp19883_c0_seq1:1101-1775(+)